VVGGGEQRPHASLQAQVRVGVDVCAQGHPAALHGTGNAGAGSAQGGVGGIGYMTISYFSQLKTPALFATGLVACLMGFVFVGGVNWLHWRLLHSWHDSMVKKE
jgi:hypothetical protein